MAGLDLRNLVKAYGRTEVLHGISLHVDDGEFVVLVGPSGCGKSTTLRLIAGLDEPTSGDIEIAGRNVNRLEPKDRNVAMVFQNYAIYPHMTVRKNIGFGLRTSRLPKREKEKRLEEVAAILEMTDLLERKPAQLSGGQRQRVAIGRAMVRDPDVFLFDEPLSNLDAQLRTLMRLEIKKLHQRVGNTIIFVTHDQVEAMTMADRIVIMNDGNILQAGTPSDVYYNPANRFVAQFIGAPSMNMLPGLVAPDGVRLRNGSTVDVRIDAREGRPVEVGVRPDDFILDGPDPFIEGTVVVREPLGHETLVYLETPAGELTAKAAGRSPPELGQRLALGADTASIHVFDASTGESVRRR
ncbi:MAG: sn-glycerol-3-phosphate ABC transporter ATP-binding protein UgpC [Paracoccaceae bacterium]|nr:sn-glycerol-3-phosphate ABC transporter ATP-binding protein UgpC [Paracoccaceae bacterium]